MSESFETNMRLALEEAELAFRQGEVPVGAVLVKDGEIVAVHITNVSKEETRPRTRSFCACAAAWRRLALA
jgi:tRNA(adenine34) deaminase